MVAGKGAQAKRFEFFNAYVDSTEDGLNYADDVINLVLQYMTCSHALCTMLGSRTQRTVESLKKQWEVIMALTNIQFL